MKNDAPRTMTMAGLQFLEALAAQRKSGCFLEIGPLFGSSTNAIDAGRSDETVPIHTIDTFEPAPWVRKRLGIDLSRDAFDKFTTGIENLHVHQGYAPDVVKESWSERIGFYFDDATHGDPGWSNNYNFFKPFFTEDAIICGDDFASGWPHIVRNVYQITEDESLKLFVIGRVWAFTRDDDARIAAAANRAFPALDGVELEVRHKNGRTHRNIAASWSWGLHRANALEEATLHSAGPLDFRIEVTRHDDSTQVVELGKEPLLFAGIRRMAFTLPRGMSVQFCLKTVKGRTENTKSLASGAVLELTPEQFVTALRLSHS